MAQVPEQQGGLVKVPKIRTGADTPKAASSGDASSSNSSSSSMDTVSSSTLSSSSEDEITSSSSSSSSSGVANAASQGSAISDQELAALQALDIRVGRIISCERHPDAERWAA
jgi:hypothetical protein